MTYEEGTIKAWAHWKLKETGVSKDDAEFAQSVLTVLENYEARITELENQLDWQGACTGALLEAQDTYAPRIKKLEAALIRIKDSQEPWEFQRVVAIDALKE